MALLKYVASVVLGGGLGYGLLKLTTPKESDIVKHLPPYSSEKYNLFSSSYNQPVSSFMNQEKPKVNLKDFEPQNNAQDTKK